MLDRLIVSNRKIYPIQILDRTLNSLNANNEDPKEKIDAKNNNKKGTYSVVYINEEIIWKKTEEINWKKPDKSKKKI